MGLFPRWHEPLGGFKSKSSSLGYGPTTMNRTKLPVPLNVKVGGIWGLDIATLVSRSQEARLSVNADTIHRSNTILDLLGIFIRLTIREQITLRLSGSQTLLNKDAHNWRVRSKRLLASFHSHESHSLPATYAFAFFAVLIVRTKSKFSRAHVL